MAIIVIGLTSRVKRGFIVHTSSSQIVRRPKVKLTSYNVNYFHLRNPWIVAWWSLAYPGFGHLTLGSVAKGIFVFSGEMLVNYMAHINSAIVYSFTGNFQQAKDILDTQWLLVYIGILVFAIWDSYRITIETNKLSVLADREYASIIPTALGKASINALDKRNPWISAAWSIILPGLGQLYNSETIKAVFLLVLGGFILVFSHALQAIGYTALGNFQQAKAIVNWQWLLNFPSFFVFAIWDAYQSTVNLNKLFDIEQAQFFKNKYQNPGFKKPVLGG